MAQQVNIRLVDDIDGTDAEETLCFSIDGLTYDIDLSKDNARQLRHALHPYMEAGRRRSSKSQGGKKAASGDGAHHTNNRAIRAWCQTQGIEVSIRGRIPQEIREAYNKAHGIPMAA